MDCGVSSGITYHLCPKELSRNKIYVLRKIFEKIFWCSMLKFLDIDRKEMPFGFCFLCVQDSSFLGNKLEICSLLSEKILYLLDVRITFLMYSRSLVHVNAGEENLR